MAITIDNPKLAKLISDKDSLVTDGRRKTREIENIESKIIALENREKRITGSVPPPPELIAEGNKLTEEVNAKVKRLNEIGKAIEDAKLQAIPAELKKEHYDLLDKREKLERERNKIAHRIQKIKDKVVPMIQKLIKPLLKTEYDDIETAKVKDGKVHIETFNHLEDFKSKFKKR